MRNNPVSNVDPDGHTCVYLNDAGDSVESTDNQSSPSACLSTGGAWADGTITNVTTDPNSNNILIQTAQREDNGNIGYVTTETAPGQWSPSTELDQVAAGVNALRPGDFIAAAAAGSAATGGLAGGLLYAMSGPGMTSLGLVEAPGTGQAIDINPNDLMHIFGKATHNLSGLVARLGSERAAYTAIMETVQREIASNGMTGCLRLP